MYGKCNMNFDFSRTYLYKMHLLTNSLDKLFDRNLRTHANISLSQFTLLLAISQHQPASQRTVATFLGVSPGAISRQVELAHKQNLIHIENSVNDRRGQLLTLTADGKQKITEGITTLEKHVFAIFDDENTQTNLMEHIVTLQKNIDRLG